jgi:hypothetical protein
MIFLEAAYPVVACVLGWAAIGKLGRLGQFTAQVAGYRLLPAALVPPTAIAVLGAELAATVLLVPPPTRSAGGVLAGLLLAGYLFAQSTALARGLRVDCGCFAGSDELSVVGPATVTRTALLLLLAVGTVAAGPTPFRPVQLLTGPLLAVLVGFGPELTQRRYLR